MGGVAAVVGRQGRPAVSRASSRVWSMARALAANSAPEWPAAGRAGPPVPAASAGRRRTRRPSRSREKATVSRPWPRVDLLRDGHVLGALRLHRTYSRAACVEEIAHLHPRGLVGARREPRDRPRHHPPVRLLRPRGRGPRPRVRVRSGQGEPGHRPDRRQGLARESRGWRIRIRSKAPSPSPPELGLVAWRSMARGNSAAAKPAPSSGDQDDGRGHRRRLGCRSGWPRRRCVLDQLLDPLAGRSTTSPAAMRLTRSAAGGGSACRRL